MMPPRFRVCFWIFVFAAPQLLRAQLIDPNFKPGADSYVHALALQPQLEGRVVVGGAFRQLAGRSREFIARLNADGSFDDSFTTTSSGVVQCIAPQPDGKLLIAGQFTRINGTLRSRIARLNADGTLDASFDPGAGASDTILSIALQSDGKIVLGGSFESVDGRTRNGIARLNPNGSLDLGFNPDATGLLTPNATPGVFSIALQADGKILFGGQFVLVGGQARNGIARVNPDGSLDARFNPSSHPQNFGSIVVQPNGKILVGGGFSDLGGGRAHLTRLNPDGSPDSGFGFQSDGGVATVFLQNDGRILVSGYFTLVNRRPHLGWVRLTSFGAVDENFSFDLTAVDPMVRAPVNAVIPLPDGGMIWGGNFKTVAGVARDNLVRISAGTPSSRLANLSARGFIATGSELAVGIVSAGGPKSLLLRAIGPTLGSFGVIGPLATPRLEAIPGDAAVATAVNAGWGGLPALATAFSGVGAFPLTASSNDSALLSTHNGGTMTARVTSAATGGSGIALAEIYDRDPAVVTGRLVNLSVLGSVGTGAQTLVPGFVIAGNTSKLLLIRAVGPGLAPFGVTGVLADPRLTVVAQGATAPVVANDDWADDATLAAAFAAAGAFPLLPDSRDAAVLVRLTPGAYTVTVSGAGESTGRALVEIYDLDP